YGCDLVNSLSSECPLAIEILVNIGNSASVDIEAGLARVQSSKTGSRCALNADAQPRLKDAIAGIHDVLGRINDGMIELMRHGAHHATGASSWQFGVGIQSKDIAHVGKHGKIAHLDGKTVVLTAEEAIEIHEFAALALPSHPNPLVRVVDPMAMEQEKG